MRVAERQAPVPRSHGVAGDAGARHAQAGNPTSGALEIVRLRHADLPDCIDIARRSFEGFDTEAVANWFEARVADNPWQQTLDGIGVGVRDGARLIAFRAMFAQPWWIDGRSTVIAFAAHTCIDPAYRGAGLGSRLIAGSRDLAALTGSTSAGNVTQKIYKKQAFVEIGGHSNDFFRCRASYGGSMQSRLGRGLGKLAGRILDACARGPESKLGDPRGFRLELPQACSVDFDALWVRARPGYAACLERSSRFLNWRIFECPTRHLSLAALRDGGGQLRGYAVWHVEAYSRHVSCAVLRDLFTAADDADARRALLCLLMRHWRRLGMSWVNLELASPQLTPLFAGLGCERLPSIGNRYHLFSQTPLSPQTLGGWFRSGLDGDYFDTRPPQREASAA